MGNHPKRQLLLFAAAVLICLLSACGSSKTTPIPPVQDQASWDSPMVSDLEVVRVYVRPREATIPMVGEELSSDLHLLLEEYAQNRADSELSFEELTVQMPEPGTLVLVINNTTF